MKKIFRTGTGKSWAALIAAYAIVLQSVLGGIILAQQSALAHGSTAVICYTSGSTDSSGDSKASLRHVPCGLCATVSAATPPDAVALPLPLCTEGEALTATPDFALHVARTFSPRLSQGPPRTV